MTMPTRQQVRARAHQQRRKPSPALEAAAQTPVIQRGWTGLKRFARACEAYEADMAAAFAIRRDTIDEAWADYERKRDAAEDEYERAAAAAGTAYEQRTAASHEPEPEAGESADAAVTE